MILLSLALLPYQHRNMTKALVGESEELNWNPVLVSFSQYATLTLVKLFSHLLKEAFGPDNLKVSLMSPNHKTESPKF